MKILLASANMFADRGATPLSSGYLKAYALKDKAIRENTEIALRNYYAGRENPELLFEILNERPDIVCFSCYSWNADKFLQLSALLKEFAPNVKVVLGGPEVGALSAEVLKKNPAVDVIVRGEGEATFAALIRCWLSGGNLEDVGGITFRRRLPEGGSEIITNTGMLLIACLDDIPSPFLTGAIDVRGEKEVFLETSRGCASRCRYCFDHKNYGCVRNFSLERVENDLRHISQFAPEKLYVVDSTFNADAERAAKVCGLVHKYFGDKHTIIQLELKAELINEALARRLGKLKNKMAGVGLQSTNPKALNDAGRAFDPAKFEMGAELLRRNKVPFQIDLIAGLPGDNFLTFKKSFEYAASLRPSKIEVFDLLVLQGTYFRENAGEFKIKFDPAKPHKIISNYSFTLEDIVKARAYAASKKKEYNARFGAASTA